MTTYIERLDRHGIALLRQTFHAVRKCLSGSQHTRALYRVALELETYGYLRSRDYGSLTDFGSWEITKAGVELSEDADAFDYVIKTARSHGRARAGMSYAELLGDLDPLEVQGYQRLLRLVRRQSSWGAKMATTDLAYLVSLGAVVQKTEDLPANGPKFSDWMLTPDGHEFLDALAAVRGLNEMETDGH